MAEPARYTPEMIEEYTRQGHWTSETFADIWDRNARNFPNKEAVIDSQQRLTLAHTEAKAIVIPWTFRDFDYWRMVQDIRTKTRFVRKK